MFVKLSISFDELKPILARQVSDLIDRPVEANDLFRIGVDTNPDSADEIGLYVEFEFPEAKAES